LAADFHTARLVVRRRTRTGIAWDRHWAHEPLDLHQEAERDQFGRVGQTSISRGMVSDSGTNLFLPQSLSITASF
jgi:hypothetical protein